MSLTEAREQQLIALIGRVEELEKQSTDLSKHALLSYVNNIVPVAQTAKKVIGDVSLKATDPSFVEVDCNGGESTVRLPAANKSNHLYVIVNNSS